MTRATLALALVIGLLSPRTVLLAQIDDELSGTFYRIAPPHTAERTFSGVQIERIAPGRLAPPVPIAPLSLPIRIRRLTGQLVEVPDHQRLYFSVIDETGAFRLLELDLIARQIREIQPPLGAQRPYAARTLVTSNLRKLYVRWLGPAALPETDIYNGRTLGWIARTRAFFPDGAEEFEHEEPFMWAHDRDYRLVLVDTDVDRVVRTFEPERWLGPGRHDAADAWRDLVLVRSDAGHDRYRVVDVGSGEVGPPLDLEGRRRAQPRLVLGGRVLALVDLQRPGLRGTYERRLATVSGSGSLYDLRRGRELESFHLTVGPDLPVSGLATQADPAKAGRLLVYVPGDRQQLDLGLTPCARPRDGDGVAARIESRWRPSGNARQYAYTAHVDSSSAHPAWAVAIRVDRALERSSGPEGWGIDALMDGRWIRWTNGLGPPEDDVAIGASRGGFVIVGPSDGRPGIVEYRIQAATGAPRSCQSDRDFIEGSATGYAIAPERVTTDDAEELAERLERMVDRACDLGWIGPSDCAVLVSGARSLAESVDGAVLDEFDSALAAATLEETLRLVLEDALGVVREALAR